MVLKFSRFELSEAQFVNSRVLKLGRQVHAAGISGNQVTPLRLSHLPPLFLLIVRNEQNFTTPHASRL